MEEKKETVTLNDTLDQMDLIDICRTFCPKTAEYTFFPSARGTFSRIDHMPVPKQVPQNSRRLKMYQASFPMTTV